ncbi:hypothetical protein BISA_1846 [Bifidobacterium saguini DSM 23967]|uniref:Uncharacterized protein n=1 Tax=Bifidobacterium saguini DSM 23967 TaxID=1437607 RepID=A0A087D6U8_9BIFI|nr:hypothetical protein [Bifidobacterium saguini]KFI91248.1 hypothetical protein BISA_1846 [Bifidobacterium saguini DSM 23967]
MTVRMVDEHAVVIEAPSLPGGVLSCRMIRDAQGRRVCYVSAVGSLELQERLVDVSGNPVAATGLDEQSMRGLRDWLSSQLDDGMDGVSRV